MNTRLINGPNYFTLSEVEKSRFDYITNLAYDMRKSQCRRQFHVAAIFKRKRLISIGLNNIKTHPMMKGLYPDHPGLGIHAEFAAIIAAYGLKEDYSKYDIYVIRIDNNGNLANSKPCEHCSKILQNCNFKTIYHS